MKKIFLNLLGSLVLTFHPAMAQVIYEIENKDGDIQYVIPSTNFASKNEHILQSRFIQHLSLSNTIRIHTGKGMVDLAEFRDKVSYFRYEDDLVDYIKWCTSGKIDLANKNNLNIRSASFLTVDKCTIGDSLLRYQYAHEQGLIDARYSLGTLIAEQLAKLNPKFIQGEPLVSANLWTNAAFSVDQESAAVYFSERAKQRQSQTSAREIEFIEPYSKISLRGRPSVENWIAKYGRYYHHSRSGSIVAKTFLGSRARLLANSIKSAYSNNLYKNCINLIPFEYVYMNYGVLSELARDGYKIKEIIFK